jgi:hypothetical protein
MTIEFNELLLYTDANGNIAIEVILLDSEDNQSTEQQLMFWIW